MAIDAAFWKGRRVLVTGHTGFKGSWLCEWLLLMGARVSGYALAPIDSPALFTQLGLAQRMLHCVGDLRDLTGLREFMHSQNPEVVLHLAAQPLVRQSYADPLETYAVNVMGTANVLETCRTLPALRAVVSVTTDKCYENREWHWGYRENEALGGHDPYSSSKACAELVTQSYRRSFFGQGGANIATARAGNVIGGGDWAVDRLIPDAVRAFQAGRPMMIRYPHSTRPWQHVMEPLHGYLALAQALAQEDGASYAEAWNFGPNDADAQPVLQLLKAFCRHWPGHPGWELENASRPHEAGFLKLDCSKACARLGWRPLLPLNDALRLSADWYRSHCAGDDLASLTQRQLFDYQSLINSSLESHI